MERMGKPIVAALLAVVTLMVAVSCVAYVNLRALAQTSDDRRHACQLLLEIEALTLAFLDLETGARGYALSGHPDYLEPYDAGQLKVERHTAALYRYYPADSSGRRHLESFAAVRSERVEYAQRVVAARSAGQSAEAAAAIDRHGKLLMDRIRRDLGHLEQLERTRLETLEDETEQLQHAMSSIVIGGAALTALVLMCASVVLIKAGQRQARADRELRESNRALEGRVDERTAELSLRNEQLQAEIHARTQALADLEFALDAARLADWTLDLATREVRRTARLDQLLGFEHDQPALPWSRLVEQVLLEDQHLLDEALAATIAHERRLRVECRVRRADDSVVYLRFVGRLEFDAQRQPASVAGVVEDCTEARLAEESLMESRIRTAAIVSTAADPIITIDEQGAIDFFNPAAERIFGYRAGEVIGQHVSLLMPERLREHYQALIERRLHSSSSQAVTAGHEFIGRKQNGEEVSLELAVTEMQFRGRRMFTGILRDVTDRQRTRQALQAAKDAAEDASRAKTAFLANTGHELRTPMNAIVGMTNLILASQQIPPDMRADLCTVRDSAQSLLRLLNDLLQAAQLDAGKVVLRPVEFSLSRLLRELLQGVAWHAHLKGLELILSISARTPLSLIGDAGRLQQILLNLLDNAVKYTMQGEIELRVDLDAELDESAAIAFSIRDTGIGIAPEHRSVIFEAFQQVDDSNTRRFGGAGLGLAICQQLTRLMGGRIWVDSDEGTGSVFHLVIPFRKNPHAVGSAPARLDMESLAVLVVDDSRAAAEAAAELLRRWNCVVTIASSGSEAWKLIEAAADAGRPFAVSLIDTQLPDGDGFQWFARLRSERPFATLPILMVAGIQRLKEVARARELGIQHLLHKPIFGPDLQDILLASLGLKARPGESLLGQPHGERQAPIEILLVEDNRANQRLATKMLERMGHKVFTAETGSDALLRLEARPFDLVLMDIQMPDMDGISVVREFRGRERQSTGIHTPIVAVTAHTFPGDREYCIAAGMDDYLSKPLDDFELRMVIETLVPKAKLVS